MQSNNKANHVTIIGGSYNEVDRFSGFNGLYGSGGRALKFIRTKDYSLPITFKTCFSNEDKIKALYYNRATGLEVIKSKDVTFTYQHPFNLISIYPRPDELYAIKQKTCIKAEDENILVFGMLEASFCVNGGKVVYDPQTSVIPQYFSDTGSSASEIIYVLNESEARALTNEQAPEEWAQIIFSKELTCKAIIVKMGHVGALLMQRDNNVAERIPVYKTEDVHCIGTGDIFSASFAYEWFNGKTLSEAAIIASKSVACYSQTGKIEKIQRAMAEFNFQEVQPLNEQYTVYLAGPFFTKSQIWILSEFYNAIKSEGISVFSPLHDVGISSDYNYAKTDIKALRNCKVLFAILEYLDSGTIFEIGYATAIGMKVIVYTEMNSEDQSLFMLNGMGCEIVKDFSTAIYKTAWYANQK